MVAENLRSLKVNVRKLESMKNSELLPPTNLQISFYIFHISFQIYHLQKKNQSICPETKVQHTTAKNLLDVRPRTGSKFFIAWKFCRPSVAAPFILMVNTSLYRSGYQFANCGSLIFRNFIFEPLHSPPPSRTIFQQNISGNAYFLHIRNPRRNLTERTIIRILKIIIAPLGPRGLGGGVIYEMPSVRSSRFSERFIAFHPA